MRNPQVTFSPGSSFDWPTMTEPSASRAKRGKSLAMLLVFWIAAIDLFWPYTNMAVLYVVPLTILAMTNGIRPLWRAVGVFIGLTYAIYILKYSVTASFDVDLVSRDFRLANRTLVALCLIGAAYLLSLWVRWTADQSDPELASSVQVYEQEVSATVAGICLVPLVLVIAGIDVVAPANYNLAILYPLPLVVCVWLQSRTLLWGLFALLLVLSAIAYFWGPPSDINVAGSILLRNRAIAAAGLLALTLLFTWEIGSTRGQR